MNRLDKKTKEAANLLKTVGQLETQVANLTAQLNKSNGEKDKLVADNKVRKRKGGNRYQTMKNSAKNLSVIQTLECVIGNSNFS